MFPDTPMRQVIGILLGVLLSGGTSLCLGVILFRKLPVQLDRAGYFSLSFVAGSACLSQAIFFICSMGFARTGVFLAIGLLSAIAAIGPLRAAMRLPAAQPLPRFRYLFGVLFLAFGTVYLVNALAPEMSPDGSAYHLPIVARYFRAHGFEPVAGNFYASLSQGIELLFLPAFSLGRHSAAALEHFLFLIGLPLMMISYGRRFGFPVPAAAAAFLVFASPLLGWDGTAAYVDVAAAAILFALFYLLQIWDAERTARLLIPIGILAGFSYAVKYTGAIAVPYAMVFVAWKLWRRRKPIAPPLLTIGALATFFILPWMVKNAIFVGNPIAPFANRFFPDSNVHVSFEEQYRAYLRQYRLTNWWSAPWELAVKGERLQGFFGPVFLLMPAALLSLRRREGRQLLLAGAVFAIPWFSNIGARFLISALPPLTLALAHSLARPAGLLPSIAVVHALLSWYTAPLRYFDDYAPRIAAFPARAALRIEPEDVYLARSSPGYAIDRMIEKQVPEGETVFSLGPVPEAWTTRQILVAQHAAANEALADMLWTPLDPARLPAHELTLRFAPRTLRRVRATQTARPDGQMWSVSEIRILKAGRTLAPGKDWRLRANPNARDLPLALDNNPVTRWRSWRAASPGMFIEIDFGEATPVDEVHLLTTPDALQSRVDLSGMDARGEWQTLRAEASTTSLPVADNLRAASVRVLLKRGIRYLLVPPGVHGANDFYANAAAWRIEPVGESGGTRLYSLQARAKIQHPVPDSTIREAFPAGEHDDPDARFVLHAAWTRDTQFQETYRHTLTYSNVPGASISAAFRGTAITYVYTRARNRGIAEVRIDGMLRGHLNLYSPDTKWQSSATYAGLGAGEHSIEIRVTGQRSADAGDCFIDLDALIVE